MTPTSFLIPIVLIAAWLLAPPALGQDVSGPARASDGDTLNLTGVRVRLHGIDAVELAQSCSRDGTSWACGREAADRLSSLVAGKSVRCEQRDMDDYGRIVATCRVGGTDLSAAMVDAGFAIALPQFTTAYIALEARAREQRRGIWAGAFERPGDYRAANRTPRSQPAPQAAPRRHRAAPTPSDVYYRGCREARAAGVAPLYRGQPGYRPEMDGDNDGIACEPYRGR
jgi:endonuclease YncB( thermonuclease family)